MEEFLKEKILANYVNHQINIFLNYENHLFKNALKKIIPKALDRYNYCCSFKHLKYKPEELPIYHADEYCSLLYFLSNELWLQTNEPSFAEKLFLLNRIINSVDIFYDRNLPDIFHLVHPIGTIIARADFKNYLVVYQGVTIGGNLDFEVPVIGKNVALFAGSRVIGRSIIGDNCQIGAGVSIINQNIESNTSIVESQKIISINSKRNFKKHFFKCKI